ncbi:MAG TPA: DMT family transporter [Candidatus Polarisedimenticolaceae bacterium]|nr:DMT family transporter [Candidatus Polarisedimenticolaceae bacterium]
MGFLGQTRSLLITGLADVFAAVREESRRPGERFGLVLMVVSAACFALMAAIAKKLLPTTPMQAVVFSRGILMTTTFVALARRQGVPVIGNHPWMLLFRGLLGYGALSCYFWSVQHLPLGDAVLLQYSHPIFVAALAPFVLHEATGRWHWPLVVGALAGVALIVGPAHGFRGAALIGLCGSMLSGTAYMAVRRLSRTEHALTILIWFPLASIPASLVATLHAGKAALPRTGAEIAGHLLVFVSALVGQWTLTSGLARAGAARATAVTMTGPVFGLAFGWLMFGTRPVLESLAGTAIVIAAVILLAKEKKKPVDLVETREESVVSSR